MTNDKMGNEPEDHQRGVGDHGQGGGKPAKEYAFFVGDQRFTTTERYLTAAQIKAYVANVEPGDKLMLEGKGNDPDVMLNDDQQIDLEKNHGPLRFAIVPNASFGA